MLLYKARHNALSLLFYLLCLQTTYSQQPSVEEDFQSVQLNNFRSWLKYVNLDKMLVAENIEEVDAIYVLNMRIQDVYNWDRLIEYCDSAYHIHLPEVLFNKFAFQMDLFQENGKIKVDAADASIIIEKNGADLSVAKWKKMGDPPANTNVIFSDLTDIDDFPPLTTNKSLEQAKAAIAIGLKKYLFKYKARMENFRFDILYQLGNKMVLESSNIVNVVLDEGYFEHLRFIFDFKREEGKVTVSYTVLGKYGAGILWAPKNSRYHDIVPKYDQAFKKFRLVMANQIGQFIK